MFLFCLLPIYIDSMRFIRMVPKLPLDITVPQYALRRRGAICISIVGPNLLYKVRT